MHRTPLVKSTTKIFSHFVAFSENPNFKNPTYKGSRIVPNLYYLDIEAWLSRMESWQARLRPVGATQDILEQQSREVKVMKNGYWVFLNIFFCFIPMKISLFFMRYHLFLHYEWFHQKYFIRTNMHKTVPFLHEQNQ